METSTCYHVTYAPILHTFAVINHTFVGEYHTILLLYMQKIYVLPKNGWECYITVLCNTQMCYITEKLYIACSITLPKNG